MLGARSVSQDASFRTKRIKNIVTRTGPAPVINSESWLLTKQQGCCTQQQEDPCTSYNCPPPEFTTFGSVIGDYRTFTGTLDPSGNVIFNIAQLTSNCDRRECENILVINPSFFTEGGVTFTVPNIKTVGCSAILQLSTVTNTAFNVTYNNIDIYATDCGKDYKGVVFNIRLVYAGP
jgi:hypothetical protein